MKTKLLLICILCSLCLFAQTKTPYPSLQYYNSSTQRFFFNATLPSSSTALTTSTTYIDLVHFANHSGSSVTVTLTDNSTNCNGSACTLLPTISVAANSVYSLTLWGLPSANGVKWSSSSSTAIDGWVVGRQ